MEQGLGFSLGFLAWLWDAQQGLVKYLSSWREPRRNLHEGWSSGGMGGSVRAPSGRRHLGKDLALAFVQDLGQVRVATRLPRGLWHVARGPWHVPCVRVSVPLPVRAAGKLPITATEFTLELLCAWK